MTYKNIVVPQPWAFHRAIQRLLLSHSFLSLHYRNPVVCSLLHTRVDLGTLFRDRRRPIVLFPSSSSYPFIPCFRTPPQHHFPSGYPPQKRARQKPLVKRMCSATGSKGSGGTTAGGAGATRGTSAGAKGGSGTTTGSTGGGGGGAKGSGSGTGGGAKGGTASGGSKGGTGGGSKNGGR
ncbi:hypothetical protein HOY82DRAFT_631616 [Tuber indicum]|nr:hypothetical protein HOY82DRAFT_631616 [Tuber indicum]